MADPASLHLVWVAYIVDGYTVLDIRRSIFALEASRYVQRYKSIEPQS